MSLNQDNHITSHTLDSNPHTSGFDPRERYELGGIIGEGGYGKVCQAYDTVRNQLVAIKIIDLEAAGDEIQDAHKEIAVMANLHCPHLIQYYASYVTGSKLWIVMEYLDAGSLLDIIKEFGPLPESHIAYILKEVLLALQYLHNERKIHRDIKAGNLLVGSDGSVKLADFGVAGQLTDSVDKRQSKIGTPFWMAPEVITESKYDGGADIWSLGITAIELATGLPPYAQKVHPFRVILLIPKNPPPVLEGDFSADFKDFVAKCLVKDPLQRPTATQMLAHPFVVNATRTEEWKTFITEKVMVNRYVPDSDPNAELVRTGSNDSNCSNWNYTQRTMGSATSKSRNNNMNPSTSSGNLLNPSASFLNVRTPRQSNQRGLGIENTSTLEDIIINSPRTPARSNSERSLEGILNSPRGLMSPGRTKSSPRVTSTTAAASNYDDTLSQGTGRSRRGSGNSETLLIMTGGSGNNSMHYSHHSTGSYNTNMKLETELTPPLRTNPIRLINPSYPEEKTSTNYSLPPLANPSTAGLNVPEMIHIDREGSGGIFRELHSSISGSSSRDYDGSSSLQDSHSHSHSHSNHSLLNPTYNNSNGGSGLLKSPLNKSRSMPNVLSSSLSSSMMNVKANLPVNSIAFPSMDSLQNLSQPPPPPEQPPHNLNHHQQQHKSISEAELQAYFHDWKQREEFYLHEIHRLKDENFRLRSISKPFLSTVSVLVRNNSSKYDMSSVSLDQYLGSGGPSHNNSSNQLLGQRAVTGGTGTMDDGRANSFRDLQSILSISSDDTTPGHSRALSPAAVVRDDIFADFATTHPNHPLLRQMGSAASSTNSLLPYPSQPPDHDHGIHPSEEKKGEDDHDDPDNPNIVLRKSSFHLPPLPPAIPVSAASGMMPVPSNSGSLSAHDEVPSRHAVPLTVSLSHSHDGTHYSDPHLFKSEETVPYPLPVIERGLPSKPTFSADSSHPPLSSTSFAGGDSRSLDSAELEMKQQIKQVTKTPKHHDPNLILQTQQQKKFLESIVEHHLQQLSLSTTTTTNMAGNDNTSTTSTNKGTVTSSSSPSNTAKVSSKLMESVIKPTLQELKQRIETNHYTPELNSMLSGTTGMMGPSHESGGIAVTSPLSVGKVEAAVNSVKAAALKEAESRKQQLENVWLLLAMGFTSLEKILSTTSSTTTTTSLPATTPTGSATEKSPEHSSATKTSHPMSSSPPNMLVDIATLLTSFTLSELDEQTSP